MSKTEKHIEHYPNGQKKEEGYYLDEKKDGLWTYWYENGRKRSEAIYKDGEKDGKWTHWDENGQKVSEGISKDDSIEIFLV